jgi:hypothetical protein
MRMFNQKIAESWARVEQLLSLCQCSKIHLPAIWGLPGLLPSSAGMAALHNLLLRAFHQPPCSFGYKKHLFSIYSKLNG